MSKQHPLAITTVTATWHPLPEWVRVLAEEVDQVGSRRVIGQKVGYSPTTISQVINKKYPGDLKKLEDRVRGALMGDSVECPVTGSITLDACRNYQGRKFSATSSFHTRLYRACRSGCPHSSLESTKC